MFGGNGRSWCVKKGAVCLLVAIHSSCACDLDANGTYSRVAAEAELRVGGRSCPCNAVIP